MAVNAQFNVAAPDSLPVKVAAYQRRRMFEKFLAFTKIQPAETVLDLGVTSDQTYSHSNYFELWYPYKDRITACGVDDARFLETLYPGLIYVHADGRCLPFADREFDFVHSSAVLEHVGGGAKQAVFLREAWRVARKGIFITTPNRWFPIEFHTVMPFAHWLPPSAFRKLCRMRGLDFFGTEEHLNLLSSSCLKRLAAAAALEHFRVTSVALCGWPSNLLLWAQRIN
jgi:methyltransferase family protein